jgi:hypothetical protein
VYEEQVNDGYETYHIAVSLKEDYTGKLNRFNDSKICRKLPVQDTIETPVIITYLSADCIELQTDCMSSKLLHTKSAANYIHHMQIKLEYCQIENENLCSRNGNRPFVIELSS